MRGGKHVCARCCVCRVSWRNRVRRAVHCGPVFSLPSPAIDRARVTSPLSPAFPSPHPNALLAPLAPSPAGRQSLHRAAPSAPVREPARRESPRLKTRARRQTRGQPESLAGTDEIPVPSLRSTAAPRTRSGSRVRGAAVVLPRAGVEPLSCWELHRPRSPRLPDPRLHRHLAAASRAARCSPAAVAYRLAPARPR